MSTEGLSRRLCEAVASWRYEDLPAPVVTTVKRFILDTLGLIAGAAAAPGIAELNTRLGRWEANGSATGLIGKRRYSPPTAALANGAAAHALDFDDQHDPARVHTGCVVFPALLAAAEDIGAIRGRDFIVAMALGSELHARFGLACYNSLGKGWHPTMVFGTLAASLGVGHMLGLNAAALNDALGMAFHQASGSAQSMRDGVLSKRLGAGFAARAAVLGAFLAKDGLTGTQRSLEGSAGLFALYERNEVTPELLMERLGESWRIPEYSFKPYPCCRCNHTAIGLGLGLHRRGISPESIAAVQIHLGNVNWLTVGAAYEEKLESVAHAQFNVSYSFARSVVDGRVDLRTYEQSALGDPRIVALTRLTRVIDDPDIDPRAIEPARVKLRLKDGSTIEVASTTIKGSPGEPMSAAEFGSKLRDCLDFGLRASAEHADRLAAAVDSLEAADDAAGTLIAAFPPAAPLRPA